MRGIIDFHNREEDMDHSIRGEIDHSQRGAGLGDQGSEVKAHCC